MDTGARLLSSVPGGDHTRMGAARSFAYIDRAVTTSRTEKSRRGAGAEGGTPERPTARSRRPPVALDQVARRRRRPARPEPVSPRTGWRMSPCLFTTARGVFGVERKNRRVDDGGPKTNKPCSIQSLIELIGRTALPDDPAGVPRALAHPPKGCTGLYIRATNDGLGRVRSLAHACQSVCLVRTEIGRWPPCGGRSLWPGPYGAARSSRTPMTQEGAAPWPPATGSPPRRSPVAQARRRRPVGPSLAPQRPPDRSRGGGPVGFHSRTLRRSTAS